MLVALDGGGLHAVGILAAEKVTEAFLGWQVGTAVPRMPLAKHGARVPAGLEGLCDRHFIRRDSLHAVRKAERVHKQAPKGARGKEDGMDEAAGGITPGQAAEGGWGAHSGLAE